MHIIHLLKQIECVSSRQSKTNTAEKNVGNMFHFVNEVWDFNNGFSMKKMRRLDLHGVCQSCLRLKNSLQPILELHTGPTNQTTPYALLNSIQFFSCIDVKGRGNTPDILLYAPIQQANYNPGKIMRNDRAKGSRRNWIQGTFKRGACIFRCEIVDLAVSGMGCTTSDCKIRFAKPVSALRRQSVHMSMSTCVRLRVAHEKTFLCMTKINCNDLRDIFLVWSVSWWAYLSKFVVFFLGPWPLKNNAIFKHHFVLRQTSCPRRGAFFSQHWVAWFQGKKRKKYALELVCFRRKILIFLEIAELDQPEVAWLGIWEGPRQYTRWWCVCRKTPRPIRSDATSTLPGTCKFWIDTPQKGMCSKHRLSYHCFFWCRICGTRGHSRPAVAPDKTRCCQMKSIQNPRNLVHFGDPTMP